MPSVVSARGRRGLLPTWWSPDDPNIPRSNIAAFAANLQWFNVTYVINRARRWGGGTFLICFAVERVVTFLLVAFFANS
ncbi:hypothetical protein Mp_3g06060 [Marchantia polymorpha subsp. ruderalis]|uniref:Uncharacterized protein n=2 Tax=Marchantia polymorpha TaxID=3197 RepID=A0AAF6AXW7_MARPO|nr:hypothetical protein MARPO_0006s0076 [Marchantia polymorpha]BBN04601.1 hypothetical protein Mp_3g06060 [Marchantia polymorpha subsp. ruderalis]|eukprot:PTQ48037.1 hypothetical protein MARPO_0006s0076 [Marchantia polymorpha]